MKIRDITGLPITSYDIIGDIAIVYIPDQYMDRSVDIAKAIMQVHKRIRSVFRKNPVEGEYRVRKLELIYGDPNTETITRENGIVLKLDVDRVFYSPRMSNDRLIISKSVREGENVFVPFAGIGPYAILIAKRCQTCRVVGVEKNHVAVEYFRENVNINRVKNVEVLEGDVLDFVDLYPNWADRVIMPLPKDSYAYLRELCKVGKDRAIFHVYLFVNSSDPMNDGRAKIEQNIDYRFEILGMRRLRGYSKSIDEYVFDIQIYKKLLS